MASYGNTFLFPPGPLPLGSSVNLRAAPVGRSFLTWGLQGGEAPAGVRGVPEKNSHGRVGGNEKVFMGVGTRALAHEPRGIGTAGTCAHD